MTVVEGGEYLDKQIKSGIMNEDLTPNFTDVALRVPPMVRSVFGPFFPLEQLHMPGHGPEEYRTLVGRMIALRAPERPGFSESLAKQQVVGIRELRPQINLFKKHLEMHINRRSYEQEYPEWLFQPHPKRQLRLMIAAAVQRLGNNDCDDEDDVDFKGKDNELLGGGKKRGIANMKEFRTDATAYAIPSIKDAWEKPFQLKNTILRYVKKADKESLVQAFKELLEPEFNHMSFVYHSDDSCVAANCADGVVYFNGDIKACDGSHRTVIFDKLFKLLAFTGGLPNAHHAPLTRAFNYLKRDLRVRFPKDRRQKVKYKFKTMRLYSGSVLTTLLNNFANLLIGMELTMLIPNPGLVTKEQLKEAYRQAGENVGYILKIVDCTVPEQLQFLKHSPTYVDGVIVPWVSLGTFIRGFGTFGGYLPHRKGGYDDAARSFIAEVVEGRKNWGNHEFNDSFHHLTKHKLVRPNHRITRVLDMEREKCIGDVGARVPIEALARRYQCEPVALKELCHHIANCQLGDLVYLPVVSHIYNVDYG